MHYSVAQAHAVDTMHLSVPLTSLQASHYALYAFMTIMPVTGIAMGYFGGKGLPFFFTTLPGSPSPHRTPPLHAPTAPTARPHCKLPLSALPLPAYVGHSMACRRLDPYWSLRRASLQDSQDPRHLRQVLGAAALRRRHLPRGQRATDLLPHQPFQVI